MTSKPQTVLELARQDAQELHKKISDNIARAEQTTWDDVKAVQADIVALGARMTTLAGDQADAAQASIGAGIKAAVSNLEAAGRMVEDKAGDARDSVTRANAAMLESAHQATQSLSTAVAAARSRLAGVIAPKPTDAPEKVTL